MVNKKCFRFFGIFLALIIVVLSIYFVLADFVDDGTTTQNITDCGILNTSFATYTLNQSINMTDFNCLGIENNSIILDCQGYNITLYGADEANWSAVATQNFNNITIKNCIFLQNFTGPTDDEDERQDVIVFVNSTNSTIFNNTFGGTGFNGSGILLDSSLNANITTNTINNSIGAAISLFFGSNSSVVENNNITTISMGINVMESPNINISSNNITSSSTGNIDQGMIRLEDSDNSIVDYNIIITSGIAASGVIMEDSHDVIVYLNTITTTGNYSNGIYAFNSSSNTIANNTFNTTGGYAIYVDGLLVEYYNHTVENNTEQGENILYLFNNDSGIVEDQTLGQLIITNSTNITIDNVTIDYDGLTFAFTNNSIINNSNFTGSADRIHGMDFFESSYNNVTNCWVKTLTGNESCVINFYSNSSDNNIFYNNVLNVTAENSLSGSGVCWGDSAPANNIWNTTAIETTNILGHAWIGGNFWTNSLGTGYSDNCTDRDGNYICDYQYNVIDNNIDYLPLADYTNMVFECKTLDVANRTYYLNQSISSNGTCFNITANGITLDFNATTITGNTTGYGINITGYNDTTIFGGSDKGVISNFSNGIYISSSSNNDFKYFYINNSVQDAILLEGVTSANNNFTGIIVENTNASHYDINFSTAGINGTWIIDIAGFANYTFTGTGGLVNFKEPSYGEIVFLEPINDSGNFFSQEVVIGSNSVFVDSSSNSGLNKSANITLYDINYTVPSQRQQYSLDDSTWVECNLTSDPVCNYFSYDADEDILVFNVSHFTYFRATVDSTDPVVSLSESSSTTSSLTITVSKTDTLSGISSCSSNRGTLSGSTLTESGLSCGTSYSYTITCTDYAGNDGSDTESFSTDACDSGGTPTTTTKTWTHTYTPSDEQFEEGYTKALSIKNRVKVKVGTNYHYVGVVALTQTKATINITSDPIQVILGIGEDAKVDVTDDGFYDVYVILNAIVSSKADVTIKSIYEEVPEGAERVETTGEVTGEEDAAGEEEEEERNLTWLWILIGVVVLVIIIIGGGIAAKKKQ